MFQKSLFGINQEYFPVPVWKLGYNNKKDFDHLSKNRTDPMRFNESV